MTSFGPRRAPTQVYLNVYDLAPTNDLLHPIGLGFYHTGVEILGSEYTFASVAGVFDHTPKAAPNARFRQQIEIGSYLGGSSELQSALSELKDLRFGPDEYNILQNNCNHFANALCWKLLQKTIPSFINRTADIGACCSCLIPKSLLEGAPVQEQNDNTTASYSVKAPMNRGFGTSAGGTDTTLPNVAFHGSGARLGGTSMPSSSSSNDNLTDRREKARKAALARLEKNGSDSQ